MDDRPRHEVAEVFRRYLTHTGGDVAPRWSLQQQAAVRALVACRTAALGGHVDECDACGYQKISYNSCRNRHCPKCQGSAQTGWLEAREADVLPVPYAHVVFTLPQLLAPLALQNPRVVYDLLLRTVARTLQEVALNPKHLGARIGFFEILHTWGQTLVHHPHVHCVVPAGGLSVDGHQWQRCRPGFFLPVRVLSRLFRGKMLAALDEAFCSRRLELHGVLARYRSPAAFRSYLDRTRRTEWVVFAKPPFDGPSQVLRYLARYTHRVAISNHRLLHVDDHDVRFRWKNYRSGRARSLTLALDEFVRRFLLHVLPRGFVRIRYYGFLANGTRTRLLAQCRLALDQPPMPAEPPPVDTVLSGDPPPECATAGPRLCPVCTTGMLRCVQVLGRPPPWDRQLKDATS